MKFTMHPKVEYTPAADLWSLGMILYYLCFGRLPYMHVEDVDILGAEIREFKSLSLAELKSHRDDIPLEVLHLLRLLLSVNPRERPSAHKILQTFAQLKMKG